MVRERAVNKMSEYCLRAFLHSPLARAEVADATSMRRKSRPPHSPRTLVSSNHGTDALPVTTCNGRPTTTTARAKPANRSISARSTFL